MALPALARDAGADVIAQERCGDELNRLSATVGALLAEADLVVVTGGASVGERYFARAAFAGHGLALSFHKVAIRPGKPVWLGRCGGTLVLGLPGNPTSAMVTAALFLRPLLRRLQGGGAGHEWRTLPLAAHLHAAGERERFARARWDDAGLTPSAIRTAARKARSRRPAG